jgi:hypothetical protein
MFDMRLFQPWLVTCSYIQCEVQLNIATRPGLSHHLLERIKRSGHSLLVRIFVVVARPECEGARLHYLYLLLSCIAIRRL